MFEKSSKRLLRNGQYKKTSDINQIHNNVNVTGRFRLILSSGNRSPDGICTTGLGLVVSPKLFSGDFLRGGGRRVEDMRSEDGTGCIYRGTDTLSVRIPEDMRC